MNLDAIAGDSSSHRSQVALGRATLVNGRSVTVERAIVVGDTLRDVQGSHAAGMQCVGSHHFNVEQLRKAGTDHAIASLQEAPPL